MTDGTRHGGGAETDFRAGNTVDLATRWILWIYEPTQLPQPRTSGLDLCCMGTGNSVCDQASVL